MEMAVLVTDSVLVDGHHTVLSKVAVATTESLWNKCCILHSWYSAMVCISRYLPPAVSSS